MKKYISIIAVFFTIGISGCKKDFLSLEVNPNQPSVTTPQLTLSGALATAAAIINTSNPQDGVWVGYWTPSGNYVPSSTIQQFQITNTTFTGVWTSLYANLTNLNNLQVTSAKDASLGNFQAIAMIMKAYDFQQLVDQFNDVPYSQAFQPSTILFPAYDKGQAIYDDLTKQLTAAIALINKSSTGVNPGVSDIVFGGNMVGWKKFANSILLRLAIRQSTKNPGNAAAAALATTAGEGYLDENMQASANPGYSNDAGKQSPFYGTYGVDPNGNPPFNNVYYRANKFFINLLTADNDPRLTRVYAKTSGGGIIDGNVFGDAVTTKSNPATSAVGPGLITSYAQRAVLFSSNESLFLQAEALADGYNIIGTPTNPAPTTPTTAQAAYERGITASFVNLGLTAGQAATYYGQAINNVGWAASSDKKQAIIYQKYISMIGYNVLEPYLEYLRTGFPVLPNPVSIDPAAISPTIPVRQFYPLSEVNSNNTQLAKEGTIDIFTSKIFWDN
ncbi:SusD/RagB family nutrient-binding outer membrane lipoprotein [soil metagenome]|jgi:hypothetical protein